MAARDRPRGPAPDRSRGHRARRSAIRAVRSVTSGGPRHRAGSASRSTTRASTGGPRQVRRASRWARPTPSGSGTPTICPALLRIAARDVGRADPLRRRHRAVARSPSSGSDAADAQHAGRARAQHRRPLRPRQRHVRAVPRPRGDDVLERLLRAPARTLEQAQHSRLERICDALELQPDDHLLEIGTGWGGMAVHAASSRGCRVTTTTISREQREYAQSRVVAAGPRGPGHRRRRRLPRPRGHLRQARLAGDDRGRRLGVVRRLLPRLLAAARAGRAVLPAGDRRSPTAPTSTRSGPGPSPTR